MFFQLSPINVRKKTIIFQLFDNDTFGADGIGEVQVPLWQISSLEAGVEESKELAPITMDKNNVPLWPWIGSEKKTDVASLGLIGFN